MAVFEYLSRADWQARPPRSVRNVSPNQFAAIEAHHSATAVTSAAAAARSYQQFHMDTKGWLDLFYNWLIHPDGTIVEGRGWDTSPRPENYMVICFIGSYDTQTLTDAAKQSFRQLRQECIRRMPQLDGRDVRWHSQRASTGCPGTDVVVWVRQQNKLKWAQPSEENVMNEAEIEQLMEQIDDLTEAAFAANYKANRLQNRAQALNAQVALVDQQTAAVLARARQLRKQLGGGT